MTRPSVGDFVLWGDEVWIVRKIRQAYEPQHRFWVADIESVSTGERDGILIDNFAPTSIRTWEVE